MELLQSLIGEREGPCVSLYLPILPGKDHAEDNRLRLSHLLDDVAVELLSHGISPRAQSQFLGPARALCLEELQFPPGRESMALFLSPSFFEARMLPSAVEPRMVVGSGFHLTPLLPFLHLSMHYFILSLSKASVRLLEVQDGTVSPRPVAGMPESVEAAWAGMERQEKAVQFHSTAGSGTHAMYHGQGGAKDVSSQELEQFVHAVAKAVDPVVKEADAPLVLATVEEEYGLYKKYETSGRLLDAYLAGNPDRLKPEQLKESADPLVRSVIEEKNKRYLEEYGNLAGTGKTSADVEEILDRAAAGKVAVLLTAEGAEQWGTFDQDSGRKELHDERAEHDEELIGLAAKHTLAHRGVVVSFPQDAMPNGVPVAAILRL